MPRTSETSAIRITAIRTEPWDHWAIIRDMPLARPDVVTALLMSPTVTSRTAVMIEVLMPSMSAWTIFFGIIRLGVTKLTAISVPMATQAAKPGVRPETSSHVMTANGSRKFRAPPQSLARSTAATSSVPILCFMASTRTMNATDRK